MKLDDLLAFTIRQNASDLHLSPGQPPLLRKDGEIQRIKLPELQSQAIEELLKGIMSAQQQRLLERHRELDFAYELGERARFRINTYHTRKGMAAALRLVPRSIPGMDELGCPSIMASLLARPQGLILVTGPTGSGKSTTLAAMLDHLNRGYPYHLITIEDPIEFIHVSRRSLVHQRQLSRDTHDYGSALRAALREDPDVILVGELRDLETIRLALTAAETGHLVLATLHTSTAARSVNRIIDVFPAAEQGLIRSLLSESLSAVFSQRLVRASGGGRRAVFEVLVNTAAVRNLIREDKLAQIYSQMQGGAAQGMCTMEQAINEMVKQGVVEKAVSQGPVSGP